jgi:Flp pilus assembly protein TadG
MSRTDMNNANQSASVHRSRSAARLLATQSGGIAAVEFAIILPLMLLLYLGSFEIAEAVALKRQVALTASTVANIVTQYATISKTTEMPDILDASSAVLTPYPVSNAVVTVSLISIDGNGNATVAWSQALNGGGRKVGQTVTLPVGLDVPNTSVVLGETTYAYAPLMDFIHIGTLDLYSSVYMSPRSSSGTILLGP